MVWTVGTAELEHFFKDTTTGEQSLEIFWASNTKIASGVF